jgi:hypothetical protein
MEYELERKQAFLYFCVIFLFFYITGYFLTFVVLTGIAMAPLEELDPEKVEDEDELLPFLENTYTRSDFIYFEINFEIIRNLEIENLKLNFNFKNNKKQIVKDEYIFLKNAYQFLNTLKKKKNDVIFLNDIILNEKI